MAASDPVPGQYIEVNFAAGPATVGQATYAILLLGNRTTAGTATVDTVIYGPNSTVPLNTTQDAINLFGQGSELHRMARRIWAINTQTPLYAVAVAESAGANATGTVTYTTNATGNGTARVWVGDDFVDTAITSGDTITTIAANVVISVNTKLDWQVTATSSVGVVTLTAKNKGLRGNWIRYQAAVLGTGVGTTVTPLADTFFTGGTTADSNTNALATILPYRYYYIVSAAEDATQLGALVSQVNTQAQPITGIRQRVFGGSVDTQSNVNTIATGASLNAARAEIQWSQNNDMMPSELAANWAAVVALEEAPVQFRCNFDFYGNDAVTQARWKVPAPRTQTSLTRAMIKTALNNGVSPIAVNPNGSTYLVSRITTRSLSGSNNDYRIRDAHKVTICDRYADDLQSKFAAQFSGKKIADDPATGQRIPGATVVTPKVVLAAVNKLTTDYDGLDLLQNVPTIIANTQAIREAAPTTRISCRIPLQTIDILHQLATELDQVA